MLVQLFWFKLHIRLFALSHSGYARKSSIYMFLQRHLNFLVLSIVWLTLYLGVYFFWCSQPPPFF